MRRLYESSLKGSTVQKRGLCAVADVQVRGETFRLASARYERARLPHSPRSARDYVYTNLHGADDVIMCRGDE